MDGGIGEAALMSAILEGAGTGALVGGGVSALTGRDPLEGALMGALTGGAFGGIGSAFGGAENVVNPELADATTALNPQTVTSAQNIANVTGDAGMQNVAFNQGFSPEAITGNTQNALFTPGADGGSLMQTGGAGRIPGQSPFVGDSNFVRTPGGGFSDMTSDISAATKGIDSAPGAVNAPSVVQNAPTSTQNFAQRLSDAGIKPQGYAPPGAQPGQIIGNNIVGANGMLYNNAQVSQFAANPPSTGVMGFLERNKTPLMIGGGLGLAGTMMKQDQQKYGVPAQETYSGPLSKFKYDPSTFTPTTTTPTVYKPVYAAEGGIMQLKKDTVSPNPSMMQSGPADVDFMHGDMYPMSNIQRSYYATPTQMPTGAQAAMASYEPRTNPLTGEETANMRRGGVARYDDGGSVFGYDYDPKTGRFVQKDMSALLSNMPVQTAGAASPLSPEQQQLQQLGLVQSHLADYAYNPTNSTYIAKTELPALPAAPEPAPSDSGGYAEGGIAQLAVGGKLLRGAGDGMSDNIRANIDGRREARLADGEFVVPADVVSHMGNGSTDAGAKQLYSMMNRVRKARTGNSKQGKQINPMKYMPA